MPVITKSKYNTEFKFNLKPYCIVITRSLTLREERRLRVFENRVLKKVFGPKRDEVTGEWIKAAPSFFNYYQN